MIEDEKIDQLKNARTRAREFYAKWKELELECNKVRDLWKEWADKAEELDYQLALVDGRCKVIETGKKAKSIKLTLEQLKHVAEVLGIDTENIDRLIIKQTKGGE